MSGRVRKCHLVTLPDETWEKLEHISTPSGKSRAIERLIDVEYLRRFGTVGGARKLRKKKT